MMPGMASSTLPSHRHPWPPPGMFYHKPMPPPFFFPDMLLRGAVLHGAPPVEEPAALDSAVPTASLGPAAEPVVQPDAQPGTVVFDASEASVMDGEAGLEGGAEDGEYVYELVLSDEWAEYFRRRAEAKKQKRGERGSDGQSSAHRGRKRGRRRGKRKRGRGKGPEAKRQKQEHDQQSRVSEDANLDDGDEDEEEGGSEGEEIDERVGVEGKEGVGEKTEAEEGEAVKGE